MRRTLQRLAMSSSTFVKFIPQGAIIQEFLVGPESRNIVLGFNTAAEYRSNPAHFGATIGRVANRLKNAKLDCLNGTVYPLAVNDPPNSLHGGIKGWGAVDWTGPTIENRVSGRETVVYKYHSVHMEEGFPGTVDVSVAYTAYEEPTGEEGVTKTVLEMEYEANLVGEDVQETAVNMTNHRYNSSLPSLKPLPLNIYPPTATSTSAAVTPSPALGQSSQPPITSPSTPRASQSQQPSHPTPASPQTPPSPLAPQHPKLTTVSCWTPPQRQSHQTRVCRRSIIAHASTIQPQRSISTFSRPTPRSSSTRASIWTLLLVRMDPRLEALARDSALSRVGMSMRPTWTRGRA